MQYDVAVGNQLLRNVASSFPPLHIEITMHRTRLSPAAPGQLVFFPFNEHIFTWTFFIKVFHSFLRYKDRQKQASIETGHDADKKEKPLM